MEESVFVEMLVKLSNAIGKKDVEMLRVLYGDLANIVKIELEEAKTAFDLFKILRAPGLLKPTYISILFETIELTGFNYLREIIEKYVPYPNEVTLITFSQYRQDVIDLGKRFSVEDLQKVSQIHGGNFISPWKLIQHLEDHHVLTKEKIPSFLENLRVNEVNKDFNKLLSDMSDAIGSKGDQYVDMLRILYTDHVNVKIELEKAKSAFDLFELLQEAGHLKPTDISILFETIELTGLKYLKKIVEKYETYPDEVKISHMSSHRQHILRLGKSFSAFDLERICRLNGVPVNCCSNQWKALQYLQDKDIVSEDKISLFCKTLKDDEIESPVLKRPKLSLPSNQDVIIREYLFSRQTRLCRNANRFTPANLNTRYQIDIVHMFTDLDLLKENKKKQDPKPTTLKDVLNIIKLSPACKVLIDGDGGIGKTTLLRYIAYNWATNQADETFKGKILFPVNVRDIDKDEDILDVIVKQMRLKDFNLKTNLPDDPRLIKRFILNHDDEIVLLLDGLDELRYGNESPLSLFKNEELENCKVILTSRSEKIDEFIKESYVHVKVKGFNADSIKKYIKKHFDYFEVSRLGELLITELHLDKEKDWFRGHQEVYSMCKNPMLLLSICIMWHDRQHLPVDKADLFKMVFRCILNQFIDKQEPKEHKISNFEDTPEKYTNAMLLLGKCMYKGLKINNLTINLKDLESNELVVLALKLGFVYKDAPNLKGDLEEIFTAPHKLIVESLVGFYLYKMCQMSGFENDCIDMKSVLEPFDSNEWEVIRESEHLEMAREFAIGFLGADAGKLLNHWVSNSFSTYHSLIRDLEILKEEHRETVEKVLLDEMAKNEKTKPHIGGICNSLKRFIPHVDPDVEIIGDEHFIQLMRIVYEMGSMDSGLSQHLDNKGKIFTESFCREESSEERGRMFAHILIAVPEQQFILQRLHEICVSDVEYLITECHKLNLKFEIREYELYGRSTPSTASYLVHILINAPKLASLIIFPNCITGTVLNNIMRDCCSKGATFKLERLIIRDNNLSIINASSFTSLLATTSVLNVHNCRLSGDIINDTIRECSRRGVKLDLRYLDIGDNNLSHIDGSLLAYLMTMTPNLSTLDMHNCSLSGDIMNDMLKECSRRKVKLELCNLNISDNTLSTINGSYLASLLLMTPKLNNFDMSNCSLSSDIINDMTSECSNKYNKSELQAFNISGNIDLSNIDASSLASLVMIFELTDLAMMNCSISGNIIKDITTVFFIRGITLELKTLDISDNDLSTINGSALVYLMTTAPKLNTLFMANCSLSSDSINEMTMTICSREVGLELTNLEISNNDFSNINGSALASLMAISPRMSVLCMSNCSLSGYTFNDFTLECIRKGVELTFWKLHIDGNNLSNINCSSLAYLLALVYGTFDLNNCSLSGDVINGMFRECSATDDELNLETLNISCNTLSGIDGALFASLLAVLPRMNTLDISNCHLTGSVMNDMMRECISRNVELELEFNISNNDLGNITGSCLCSLVTSANQLDVRDCSLSSDIVSDMIRELSSTDIEFELELVDIIISGNDLGNVDGILLASLMSIATQLHTLDVSNCGLSGVIMNDMIQECCSNGVTLELNDLNISNNNLSNIAGSSLASLMRISSELNIIKLNNCCLSGEIINDMVNEVFSTGGKLRLSELNVSDNNLSNITDSSLTSLFTVAPQLNKVCMNNCCLSNVITSHVIRECSNRDVTLTLESHT